MKCKVFESRLKLTMNGTKKDWPHSAAVTQKLLHKFQCKLWECPACNTKVLECGFHLFDKVKNDVIEIYVIHDEKDILWVIWRFCKILLNKFLSSSKKVLNILLCTNYSPNMSLLLMFLYTLYNLEVSAYLGNICIKFCFILLIFHIYHWNSNN